MANVSTTFRSPAAQANQPTIYNLSMPLVNTEYSQVLSNGTKKLTVKTRDRTARLRIAFVAAGTATLYITVEAGAVYSEDNLDLNGVTIYLLANKATQTAEILQWV